MGQKSHRSTDLFRTFFQSSQTRRRRLKGLAISERLESRTLLTTNAVPVASLTVPPDPFLGEQMNFTVSFDNTSTTQTGYGPYVDLVLPATGIDGAGAATDDGITFSSATYLGATITSTVLTFDAAGHATHPYAKDAAGNAVIISGTAGDQLVVLQLPFGSFTPTQPVADINIVANVSNLADVNQALNIKANGGFQFGNDALDNPTSDPSLLGAVNTVATTPTLLKLRKEYVGPEDETATGPNFVRQYKIIIDIAAGQTLTNLDLTDLLANNVQFMSVVSTSVHGASVSTTNIATPSTTIPGGTLTRRFASVTGTTSDDDAELLFSFYAPLNDSQSPSKPVIDANTGDDATASDDAKAGGNWVPIDVRDLIAPATFVAVTSDTTPIDHTLIPKSIAIQNGVTNLTDSANSAGDVLQYTLQFQISDYFAFQNISVSDIFSDGQVFVPGSIQLSVDDGHASTLTNVAMSNSNFSLSPNFSGGKDQLVFDVSGELQDRGYSPNGRLVGGAIPNGGTGGPVPQSAPVLPFGGTVATITFRTRILENFEIDYPSGDRSVDQGDVLTNSVDIHGDLLSVANLTTPTGQSEDDTSGASVQIARGTISKTIYAINGNTTLPSPLQITPGDTVTYRLTATLPSSDVENFTLSDFLPLPIFNASELGAFDDVTSAAVPAAGHAKFGPSDTLRGISGIVPAFSSDAVGNSLQFSYGDYDDPLDEASTADILFTVTVSNAPFADGLFLTNQMHE
ncbi:MAG: hypothetical protein JWM11_3296, partial [Planctomycetaceae bacterium]|nr:hypothetical protein [Planctomycetaceae bacterium]